MKYGNTDQFHDVMFQKSTDRKSHIAVLDTKRSNAISIGMTKLPSARTIKQAIMKFDNAIMNKDQIEVSQMGSTPIPRIPFFFIFEEVS